MRAYACIALGRGTVVQQGFTTPTAGDTRGPFASRRSSTLWEQKFPLLSAFAPRKHVLLRSKADTTGNSSRSTPPAFQRTIRRAARPPKWQHGPSASLVAAQGM
jgi:hypothetical protein